MLIFRQHAKAAQLTCIRIRQYIYIIVPDRFLRLEKSEHRAVLLLHKNTAVWLHRSQMR